MSYDTEHYYALHTFLEDDELHNIWNIVEENDQVAPIDVKKFTEHCVAFIDSLEIEK